MKRAWIAAVVLMLAGAAQAGAADFGGKKFYINPGHGGHDSDDRPTPLPLGVEMFYESDGNLSRGLHLRDFLTAAGAEVKMSRVTNTSADDLNLTTIAAQANSYGGYFISLHTNGANASANYVLGLYRSSAETPSAETVAGSKSMAQEAVNQIESTHLTDFTAAGMVRGDYSFYGYNLGVLRTNNCQGYLIESTFHDYRPDGLRLKSDVFNRFTAWQLARAAVDNCGGAQGASGTLQGCVVGDVRDLSRGCGYTEYVSRGRDRYLAVNGAAVRLYDSEGHHLDAMTTDDCCNGVYGFFNLPEGTYTIEVSKPGYRSARYAVDVSDNNVTRQLVDLTPGSDAPELRELWCFSQRSAGNPQWVADALPALRNMCYGDGKLFVTAPTASAVYVVNAADGSLMSKLDMSGIEGGTFSLMDVKSVDNKIVGCNLTTKADEPLKVYVWDAPQSKPRCIMSTLDRGGITRLGDTFDITGTLDHGELLFVSSGDNAECSSIVRYTLSGGLSDGLPQFIDLKTESGQPVKLGVSPRVRAADSGDYWLMGQNSAPALADSHGVVSCVIPSAALASVTLGNDFRPFRFDNRQYALATTYTPATEAAGSKALTDGKMVLIDASGGWADSREEGLYPADGLGATPNDTFSTSVYVNTDGEKWIQAWLLVARQGMASYTFGEVPDYTESLHKVSADSDFELTVDIQSGRLSVHSNRQIISVSLYDIAGSILAHSDSPTMKIDLQPGIYIIKATDVDSRTRPLKFAIH